jgi:hypothetical protein
MSVRNVLLCVMIAVGSAAMPAAAQITINIGVAPPAPRYEVVPAPRSGYAWAPGYWRWENERHVWRNGRWLEARSGSHWVADSWEPRDGRHYYKPGKWERDHDGDGNGKGHSKGKGWAKGHDK